MTDPLEMDRLESNRLESTRLEIDPLEMDPLETSLLETNLFETDLLTMDLPVSRPHLEPDRTDRPRVGRDSHLTLHYRLTLAATGAAVIDTFDGKPATLQLGIGQMAEPLELALVGLVEGEHRVFDLEPERAFGSRNPALIQRVSRAMLARESNPGEEYEPGDLVEFPSPGGGRFAGVLKSIDDEGALFDFNHPLAGRSVRFEVRIVGVL